MRWDSVVRAKSLWLVEVIVRGQCRGQQRVDDDNESAQRIRDMKKYQLTEDLAHDRKHWMIKIIKNPANDIEEWSEKSKKQKIITRLMD